MTFINNNVLEAGQDTGEAAMDRQDAQVKHIWVRNEQLGSIPDLPSVSLHAKLYACQTLLSRMQPKSKAPYTMLWCSSWLRED